MLDSDFLEPERLRAFVAVAETGSFSRAATRLKLSQPTISILVRRLEEAIGQRLIERRVSSANLTKTGEELLGYAHEMLEVAARARRQLQQPPLDGSVRLGLVDDFNYAAFAEILASLRRRHSRFELSIVTGSTPELFTQLRAGVVDVVLAKRSVGGTEGEFLCRQKMAWVGEPQALQNGDDAVPLVVTRMGTFTREVVLRALREAGRRWSIRFEAPTVTGMHAAVLAGLGVTAFGIGMIPPDLSRVPAEAGLPPLDEADLVIGHNPADKDPVVCAFTEMMRTIVPMIIARLEEEQGVLRRGAS